MSGGVLSRTEALKSPTSNQIPVPVAGFLRSGNGLSSLKAGAANLTSGRGWGLNSRKAG